MGRRRTRGSDPLLAHHARLWGQLTRLLTRRAELLRRARRTARQQRELGKIDATVLELRRQSRRISEVLRDEAWAVRDAQTSHDVRPLTVADRGPGAPNPPP